ncbi:MAG: glutamine--fructose-6-phosphate transaminase (isomerizing) [Gammaproteobacteria bacterium]
MCGIVGAVAQRDISQILLDGLVRLEYRGYDSAGMAVINEQQELLCLRAVGKVKELINQYAQEPLQGHIGIAHTRWATHGKPTENNAHPQISQQQIAIVHNGIVENHAPLRQRLIELGYEFSSETDTEVIVHLVHYHLREGKDLLRAVQAATAELKGAFALGIINSREPNRLFAVRKGSPLVIGVGQNENFIASDPLALLPVTQQFIYLDDGDIADITVENVSIINIQGQFVQREVHSLEMTAEPTEKGHYRHYMMKEIFEQPQVIRATVEAGFDNQQLSLNSLGEQAISVFSKVERMRIVACGTSFHAGLIAKYWFEGLVGLPCQVEVASEFRYRKVANEDNTLFITISQSGETADTLAALQQAKTQNYLATLAICNVPQSSLVREADLVFLTRAGSEIGVASTKAFTTQLTALLMLAAMMDKFKQRNALQEDIFAEELRQLPAYIEQVLALDKTIQLLAETFADKNNALFLGRGTHYPVALEGALKLKELSYIHAEAYPAGELKHGPLALVDKNMPVIAVAPNNALLEKLKANLQEVRARGGQLYVFADPQAELPDMEGLHCIAMPHVPNNIAPIVYSVPLQLLAYHVAVLKGTDVDQPRNLAKSVTVE